MMPLPSGTDQQEFTPRIGRVLGELAPGHYRQVCVTQLNRYLQLVSEWNARMDLTAARNPDELVDLFIADAAAMLTAVGPNSLQWVDIGSGAGAPGLPLKLMAPHVRMTLVEPLAKRVSFMRTVIGTLETEALQVRRARSENCTEDEFDVAISRATLKPADWLKEGSRMARRSCWVLLAKDSPPTADGWTAQQVLNYRWPLTGVSRTAVCYVPTAVAADS